jgi:hypothetical protein
MRGKTKEAHDSLLPGLQECFHRASGSENPIHIPGSIDSVTLVEIETVRAQAAERLLEFATGTLGSSRQGLAGKEGSVTVRFQREAELFLGLSIAVRGRNIEVVHSALDGLRNQPTRLHAAHAHEHEAAQPDNRELNIRSEVSLWERGRP